MKEHFAQAIDYIELNNSMPGKPYNKANTCIKNSHHPHPLEEVKKSDTILSLIAALGEHR